MGNWLIPVVIITRHKSQSCIEHLLNLSFKQLLLIVILLTKTTAAQNEVEICYPRMFGLNYLAVIFAASIYLSLLSTDCSDAGTS